MEVDAGPESEAGHLDEGAPSRGWPIQRHADEPRLTIFKEQAVAVGRGRLVRQARACDLLLHPTAERYLSVCLSIYLYLSIWIYLCFICISLYTNLYLSTRTHAHTHTHTHTPHT